MTPRSEMDFWSRQLSEHALFMNLGLEVEPYKSNAGKLHTDWEKVRAQLALIPQNDVGGAMTLLAQPVATLRGFKVEVHQRLKNGEWSGWLFPLFIDHTIRELDYFTERVWGGGLPAKNTLCDNLQFMAEHALFAAHLLDPSEGALIQAAADRAQRLVTLHGACMQAVTQQFVVLSVQATQALDTYFTTQPVSAKSGTSVIHPVLADHVVREGRQAMATMNELLGSG